MYEGFMDWGWDFILPGRRELHEPQSISNQPVGLGFRHCAVQYRSGGSPFSSLVCWSCKIRESFFMRRWDPILPGWRWLMLAPWLE